MTTRRPALTIIDALEDPALFGGLPAFQNLRPWRTWLVFLRAVYGLPLDEDQRAIFTTHTGHATYDPPAGGWREAVAIVGRQAGKTRIAATIAAFAAMTAPAEPDGTETYAVLVAQDERGAVRTLFQYATSIFATVPVLARSVVTRRASTLTLETGCTLAVYPCRPAAVRGLRAHAVVCDELAFYRSSEGYPTDLEMLRAVRPCLATTDGRLVVLSSPYGQAGALHDLHRRHFGQAGARVLVWQASAPTMNPTLPADYLARLEQDDPEAYRSEVLGEFRAGVSTLFPPDVLADALDVGVRGRAPAADHRYRYVSFVDAASGSGADAFALAIAHADGDRLVLDVCRAWRPPFSPAAVIGEAVDELRRYGLTETSGDRYAAGFVVEGFRTAGVTYRPAALDRSALYLEALPLFTAGAVRLLDDAELVRELRGLERRRGQGRDRVDHRRGSHDDRANAAAGALVAAADGRRRRGVRQWDFMTGELVSGFDAQGNEWRDRQPWQGVFPADTDSKGRALGYPARFVQGRLVEYVR